VKAFQDATAAFDSAGMCIFTSFAWGLADVAPQVQVPAARSSRLRTALIGERIWNMERDFNNRAGFTASKDDLPKRLLTEPAKTGPAKGLVKQAARDAAQVLRSTRLGHEGRPPDHAWAKSRGLGDAHARQAGR
jgi:aldehyde:ferredoxin oxidoreductase